MILADTSIWVDHFRAKNADLHGLLTQNLIITHPFVIGELALGYHEWPDRSLAALQRLPEARAATDRQVLQFITLRSLGGRGIGYVDAHLLASVLITPDASLWTRDRRMNEVGIELGLAADLA